MKQIRERFQMWVIGMFNRLMVRWDRPIYNPYPLTTRATNWEEEGRIPKMSAADLFD